MFLPVSIQTGSGTTPFPLLASCSLNTVSRAAGTLTTDLRLELGLRMPPVYRMRSWRGCGQLYIYTGNMLCLYNVVIYYYTKQRKVGDNTVSYENNSACMCVCVMFLSAFERYQIVESAMYKCSKQRQTVSS
jgi:hypothetical protein